MIAAADTAGFDQPFAIAGGVKQGFSLAEVMTEGLRAFVDIAAAAELAHMECIALFGAGGGGHGVLVNAGFRNRHILSVIRVLTGEVHIDCAAEIADGTDKVLTGDAAVRVIFRRVILILL